MESIITQILSKFNTQTTPSSAKDKADDTPSKEGELQVRSRQNNLIKFRNFINKFFILLILMISVLIAFFAGRTVKFLENRPNFTYEVNGESQDQAEIEAVRAENTKQNMNINTVVASSGGTKYYFVWCKGSENIKEKNKRYFADEAAAQKAGYTLAASCK